MLPSKAACTLLFRFCVAEAALAVAAADPPADEGGLVPLISAFYTGLALRGNFDTWVETRIGIDNMVVDSRRSVSARFGILRVEFSVLLSIQLHQIDLGISLLGSQAFRHKAGAIWKKQLEYSYEYSVRAGTSAK